MSDYPVVNSYNGWDPLEEIVVGTAFHLDYSTDVSFRLFFAENQLQEPYIDRHGHSVRFEGDPTNRVRDELIEDQEGFVALLEGEGIRVRRPESLTEVKMIQTPDWQAAMGHALMSRDMFLVIGQEIIETAPMVRARYFESHLHHQVSLDQLPEPMRKWDRIDYVPIQDPVALDNEGLPLLASQSIGMNVLSLDHDKVVVQDIQVPLMKDLEKAGFTPIPCRWRHGRTLGGGFHCMTLDVRRRSVLEDYFS